jgi:DNA modification methylase
MTQSTEKTARLLPQRRQLVLPLLAEIDQAGGEARPVEIYGRLADRLGLDAAARSASAAFHGANSRLWDRTVRWARQTALARGLLASPERGVWSLTDKGRTTLRLAERCSFAVVFETRLGSAVWALAERAAQAIEPGSVNLIFTSPPYPIATARSYGGISPDAWLDWMQGLTEIWSPLLAPGGSLMVNIGYAFDQGAPVQSLYPERFVLQTVADGWHLCDRLFWHNPIKLPTPMPWVVNARERCKQSIEPIFWFSRGQRPKADNRRVLTPYSARTLKIEIGKERAHAKRAGGQQFAKNSFSRDNGGAIPSNLIEAYNTGGLPVWRREARAAGLPDHPAPFPLAVPERAILLATEPGDLVYDPMAGSMTTALAAEKHGRRWLASERSCAYLEAASFRLQACAGFERQESHLGPGHE